MLAPDERLVAEKGTETRSVPNLDIYNRQRAKWRYSAGGGGDGRAQGPTIERPSGDRSVAGELDMKDLAVCGPTEILT